MLLAVDIGNSNMFFGVIKGGDIIADFRIRAYKTFNADSHEKALCAMLDANSVKEGDIKDIIISSVVPEVDAPFKELMSKLFNTRPIFANSDMDLGIKANVENPQKVGMDRLATACAAHFQIKGNVIVIDFGTATTFDCVTKAGEFIGGAIAPGIGVCAESLHKTTSKLPLIEVAPPKRAIGRNTETAMQSGIFNGYIGLVKNIVSKMKKEMKGECAILATGGAARLFKKHLRIIDLYDDQLVLKGLGRIYALNNKRFQHNKEHPERRNPH